VHDTSVPIDLRDRVQDWHEELLRIAPRLSELPDAARQAVYAAVEDFLREDSGLDDVPRRLANAA
jgi:hypothetical protein